MASERNSGGTQPPPLSMCSSAAAAGSWLHRGSSSSTHLSCFPSSTPPPSQGLPSSHAASMLFCLVDSPPPLPPSHAALLSSPHHSFSFTLRPLSSCGVRCSPSTISKASHSAYHDGVLCLLVCRLAKLPSLKFMPFLGFKAASYIALILLYQQRHTGYRLRQYQRV